MKRGLTDFIEGALDDVITTEAPFEETSCRATVLVALVVVITFLGFGEKAITTERKGGDEAFNGAGGGACIV
ncbi:MAG: hypothetical protein Greene041662_209 [Candidatus Peregrinibacteria bacterium Greene0416_62]|nr:MAG: hypothetical protein Greene041662_209 [Candidatus Peregrinibacteria bacterium Greene0416_62]